MNLTLFQLALAVQVLLPGYIFVLTRRRFTLNTISKGQAEYTEKVFHYLAVTAILLVLNWPLSTWMGINPVAMAVASVDGYQALFLASMVNHPFRWSVLLVLVPLSYAVLWTYLDNKGLLERLAKCLHLPAGQRFSYALQNALWQHRDCAPILEVTLKTGDKVYGSFNSGSSAATEGGSWPDLYLTVVYDTPKGDQGTNDMVLDENATGLFVLGSEIRMVKFFKNPADSAEPATKAPQEDAD